MPLLRILALTLGSVMTTLPALGASYHIDPATGDDTRSGLTPAAAWRTLARAAVQPLEPGDAILLARGRAFPGKLALLGVAGTPSAPVRIAAYGEGPPPRIDAAGYIAGVHLRACAWIEVHDLEITADGGAVLDGSPEAERHGVLIDTSGSSGTTHDIVLAGLDIHDIYPGVDSPHEGKNPTTYLGYGIRLRGTAKNAARVRFERCRIARVGFKAIAMNSATDLEVLDNFMQAIGGPAIQPGNVDRIVVRGNTVDGSGAYSDPRMHGRGSGIWPWTCTDVLIEKNRFMHARGRADSCGVHIDFNCRDVIVQYNLSYDNEGGFVEVLGNNHNCTYRYNISINDGARRKGVDGATADGRTLWTAGWVGRKDPPHGPYHTYIYNNTIYTDASLTSTFAFNDTTEGLLIANNIFYIQGPTRDGSDLNRRNWTADKLARVVLHHNLWLRADLLPESIPFSDTSPVIGDPGFANPGGTSPEDYIPSAIALVRDRGTFITKIPGDPIGLKPGLAVAQDFFGNPVRGLPDIGAVELGTGHLELRNISTRGLIGEKDDILIAGFVIGGTRERTVLIRAAGPALAGQGISQAVADPVLTVFDNGGRPLATNLDWGQAEDPDAIAAAARQVGAFPFESGSDDAALLLTLPPGGYTVQVAAAGAAAGIALVEVYTLR